MAFDFCKKNPLMSVHSLCKVLGFVKCCEQRFSVLSACAGKWCPAPARDVGLQCQSQGGHEPL